MVDCPWAAIFRGPSTCAKITDYEPRPVGLSVTVYVSARVGRTVRVAPIPAIWMRHLLSELKVDFAEEKGNAARCRVKTEACSEHGKRAPDDNTYSGTAVCVYYY
ncbi:Hypp8531 [Branchiostoma lanceolatum]|uniref:Hypp8531 protein n=1 Tax=Branchiostoma lanceolatum TaxID=7740 RepID=A0A8J9Z880_BRALA|nr:Hypp8531 [Branchiostoma lanceolatum]